MPVTEGGLAGGEPERAVGAENAERRPSILSNVVDLGSSQLVTWALGVALTIVQPRFLGPTGQGQLRLAYSVWIIVDVMVSLGTASYLTLQIAKNRERGMALVRPVLRLRLIGYVIGWAAVVTTAAVLDMGGTQVLVVVLIGLAQMSGSVAGTARAALMGLEQMRYPAMADVITKVVATVVVIVVLLLGGNVVAVAAIAVATAALNAWMLSYYFRRFRRPTKQQIALRAIVAGAAGLFVADAALVVYQQIDTIIMAALVDKEQLGWYAAADQLFGSLLFVPTIILLTLFPVFSRLNEFDPERLRSVVSQAVSMLLLLSTPVGFGVIVLGRPLARLLFGEEFDGAGQVLSVFGIVIIITAQTILIGRYAIATGHQRFWNVLMIASIAATVPLDLALVPWTDDRFGNGAIGGALAYVVTELFMLTVGLWRFGAQILDRRVVDRAIRSLFCGGVMAAAIWPLRDQLIVLPIALGAVVFTAVALATKTVGEQERELFRRLSERVRRSP